jgi:hypothetical protein
MPAQIKEKPPEGQVYWGEKGLAQGHEDLSEPSVDF